MLIILPEVVDIFPPDIDIRDPVFGIKNYGGFGSDLFKFGLAAQIIRDSFIMFSYPF